MSNNEKFNRDQFDSAELVKGLNRTAVPMALQGTIWSDTTPKLSQKVASIIADTFGIREIDQVFIYPEKDKSGNVVDFGVNAYFLCDQNGNGNIRRIGTKPGSNRTDRGSIDLRSAVPNRLSTGGFQMSELFKQKVGSIACLTDNGDIVVKADKDRRIATVSLDFWKVMTVVMDVDPDSAFNFMITDCQPLNTKSDCMDFRIEIYKTIERSAGGKSRKSNIDYSARNRQAMFGNR